MALLTREEEKENCHEDLRKSKEEIKRINRIFPGTFSELLHALESLKGFKG